MRGTRPSASSATGARRDLRRYSRWCQRDGIARDQRRPPERRRDLGGQGGLPRRQHGLGPRGRRHPLLLPRARRRTGRRVERLRYTSGHTSLNQGSSYGAREKPGRKVPRRFSSTSHLVWGRVPQTGIVAAVVVLERGNTSASTTAEHRTLSSGEGEAYGRGPGAALDGRS